MAWRPAWTAVPGSEVGTQGGRDDVARVSPVLLVGFQNGMAAWASSSLVAHCRLARNQRTLLSIAAIRPSWRSLAS